MQSKPSTAFPNSFLWLLLLPALADSQSLSFSFDQHLKSLEGAEPSISENIRFVPGYAGKAAHIERPARLAYSTAGLSPDSFTISFRVRHPKALKEYFYQRLVYFYHETADLKNRIGILKRAGTNQFVFFFGNGKGRAKGENFAGDWFAMATGPRAWEGGTWHQLLCAADRKSGKAQFMIDGRKVAEASGDQFPNKLADIFWIGSQQGHSWMRGDLDELRIESKARFRPGPVEMQAAPAPVLPSPPILRKSVGQLTGKEFTLNLDFFDICIGTDAWDMQSCDSEMERLMAMSAHYGADRILFRISVCGAVCYYTSTMARANEKAFANYKIEGLDGPCANIPSLHRRMAAVMRRIDPLAACLKYAHKHGMKVYAWVTLFDSMYYATDEEFFQKHPEYTWESRDGKKHIPGVPCYAYPEVREYRLKQVKELLGYGVDGIYFSVRSHSPWPGRGRRGGNEGARGYGYNPPVIEEYQRRFGLDPRQARPDSLDELRFVQLKADFLNKFLSEVHEEVARAGRKLALNTSASISDPVNANWMYVDADTLLREKVIDELCLMTSAGTNLNHWRLLSDGQVKLTTWASIHGRTYKDCLGRMRTQFTQMLENPTSAGSAYHELANLIYPDCWEEAIVDVLKRK